MQYFFIVLVVSFLTGCAATPATDKHMATANDIDPTGRYALIAVDGVTIPAAVSHGDAEIKVHSGVFTINADGTCSSKTVFSPPSGGQVTQKVNATYTRNGSNLVMQWEGAGMTTGTVDGNTFTMDNHGMIFVYSRSGRIDDTMKHDQANGCLASLY